MQYFQTQVTTNADKVHFDTKVIIIFIRKASEDDHPIKTVYDSDSAVNLFKIQMFRHCKNPQHKICHTVFNKITIC